MHDSYATHTYQLRSFKHIGHASWCKPGTVFPKRTPLQKGDGDIHKTYGSNETNRNDECQGFSAALMSHTPFARPWVAMKPVAAPTLAATTDSPTHEPAVPFGWAFAG